MLVGPGPNGLDSESASSGLYSSSLDDTSFNNEANSVLQTILPNLKFERLALFETTGRDQTNYKELFNTPDAPDNIAIDSKGNIIASTREKLIERLTTLIDFLLSFRSFMSAEELSKMMSFRLQQAFFDTNESLKLRTFVVLRQWLRQYYGIDFVNKEVKTPILDAIETIREASHELTLSDHQILLTLRKFVLLEESIMEEIHAVGVRENELVVRNRTVESFSAVSNKSKSASWTRKFRDRIRRLINFEFEDSTKDDSTLCPSIEMAVSNYSRTDASLFSVRPCTTQDLTLKYETRACLTLESSAILCEQFCLIESRIFCSVPWTELLRYPPRGEEEISPYLRKSIDHFNQTCQWLINEILRSETATEQALVIEKLIRIALKCLKHANFNSLLQIVLSLQNPLVDELFSWKKVNEKERRLFDDMVTFCSPIKNFRQIRRAMELQELAATPCIPFTGLYLADLVCNNERPTGGKTNLIPWFKYQISAKIIRQFRTFQLHERQWDFEIRPELYRYLEESIEKTVIGEQ